MSDNSNSTGSSASSTNSWTLLSPEEAAVENVGPVDDGTESLGDVPSLSEEVAGAAVEFKASDIPIETVLSEEGHQVCQETSPESSEGPIPSSPTRMSPLPQNPLDPADLDLESQPPVIHEIDTSSPSDNEHLGAIPFVTNIDLGAPLDIPAAELPPSELEESCSAPPMTEIPVSTEPVLDTPADMGPIPASPAGESLVFTAELEVNIPTETITATDPPSHVDADISFVPESTEQPSPVTERLVTEDPIDESPAPETVGSVEAEEEAAEPSETVTPDEREEEQEPSTSFDLGDTSSFDDGLRRRNVPSFDAPRLRTSDEEDEDEEVEFKLAEKKEEKPWFSLNKCIVGALILLFLGSLFLSGFLSDLDYGDFDASELSDGEQSQDWLSSDPQDMKELLDKLTQENQQIALLEAQLQSQKEELDSALKTVAASGDEKGKADLEKENTKLKEELSTLPELKKELESLRARVTELNQLSADQKMPPATPSSAPQPGDKAGQSNQKAAGPERTKDTNEGGRLKEELQRQKVLLEESRKRLEGMKKNGGGRKNVRDNLEEIQKKLSEQVERWGKKKPQESKWKGNKGKNTERDHRKKEEKKEWRGEKEWKHSKEGGWKDKEEKKEKEWKSQKQNSHKEAWRKHQDEWERKKDERRVDREERRKEKPWHSRPSKNSHHHNHHHQDQQRHQQPRQPHQYNHNDFWRDQEQKLRRNVRPQLGCSSVDDCASKEGLYAVELSEFEELLEGYLSKLEGSSSESKDKIRKLTAEFFEDGVFIHDRVLFSDFAEDIADILEDMADVLEDDGEKDDDSLEEEMEEFEREALWKFAATA
ncbi:pre-B-cell leukemia transcription factor-interacting protein 1-like isoform X1 [Seriola lalandi dorsalis]|uniref:pre-B-cell leukemia transcription factor-interacting protein 1-like isoform X1 n=1 Tax=Seriola lalandi dorsalis TaxID=1841481 RepID=UPI000C6FC95A|nr:pre-B-cell leukemia transcription factor-interacting protein 1-like isoform X1 [Seriola lalandi dorsalis]XP_023265595.1 pre-B-cell leukemia transcription factor-interacting protein 1-like isoform X1 [Seriola lalandi dorsalis]XP_023265596.1 pre-B-cell leukemia transcription factor-interacting protein 1-like isoform X1 [Seriola lalandi dorsalis]